MTCVDPACHAMEPRGDEHVLALFDVRPGSWPPWPASSKRREAVERGGMASR